MNIKALLIKSGIGLTGLGGLGFAVQQGYHAINSESRKKERNNIENKLKKEGYEPLTKGSVHFAEILASYKKIVASQSKLKFGDFNGEKATGELKSVSDTLWKHCENSFSSELTDEIFNKAKMWCVEPISVSSIINKKGMQALGETSGIDQSKWDEKVKKYRAITVENEKVFQNLELGSGDISVENRNKVKQKCDETGKIKNHEVNYENSLKVFEDWCTNK